MGPPHAKKLLRRHVLLCPVCSRPMLQHSFVRCDCPSGVPSLGVAVCAHTGGARGAVAGSGQPRRRRRSRVPVPADDLVGGERVGRDGPALRARE